MHNYELILYVIVYVYSSTYTNVTYFFPLKLISLLIMTTKNVISMQRKPIAQKKLTMFIYIEMYHKDSYKTTSFCVACHFTTNAYISGHNCVSTVGNV